MDTDNVDEQPHIASSNSSSTSSSTASTANSSNNSSSSNLLVNLPMMPPEAPPQHHSSRMLQTSRRRRRAADDENAVNDDDVIDDDDDDANADDEADDDQGYNDDEIHYPSFRSMSLAHSRSPSTTTTSSATNAAANPNPITTALQQHQSSQSHVSTAESSSSSSSVFISPSSLLFTSNPSYASASASSSSPSSSSSASTSTSSHSLQQQSTTTTPLQTHNTPSTLYAQAEQSIHLESQQLILQQQQQQEQMHSFPNSSIHQQQQPPLAPPSPSPSTPPPTQHSSSASSRGTPDGNEGGANVNVQPQPLVAAVATLEPSSDEDNNEQGRSIADDDDEELETDDATAEPRASSSSTTSLNAAIGDRQALDDVDIDLRADVATTSSQRTRPFAGDLQGLNLASSITSLYQSPTASEPLQPAAPTGTPLSTTTATATTLPHLLQQQRLAQAEAETKFRQQHPSTAALSAPYFSHSFHAHQQQPFHYQASSNLASSCGNLFSSFHQQQGKFFNGGFSMFGHNESGSSTSGMHASTSQHSLQQQQQQLMSNCSNTSIYNNGAHHSGPVIDRLKLLYPNVNEAETPLPRAWSPHDKCLSIGLSQNNLRVHFKSVGKQHNDSASVRTAHPIPPTCGIFYFEVKILSKGKNVAVGLTTQQFRMNRLPGHDKNTYGYHGNDGNSFSSSNNGLPYGPSYSTNDVIGCCVNFVNNTCFYTKNGIDLGISFRDLPTKLYPTVGLSSPGEEVETNFGQEPFKFDQVEDMMKQMRAEMKQTIYNFPMTMEYGDPTTLLHKLVSSYLVHNAYSDTAEAFARNTSQTIEEDMPSIRNRQKILKLIMTGKMGQAIEHTLSSYPGLLESNKNLWFMLKCRQFIEMVNGSDLESTKTYQNGKTSSSSHNTNNILSSSSSSGTPSSASLNATTNTNMNSSSAVINNDNHQHININLNNNVNLNNNSNNHHHLTDPQELKHNLNLIENCAMEGDLNSKNLVDQSNHSTNLDYLNDVEMENNGHTSNGNGCKNGSSNNFSSSLDLDEEMDIDMAPSTRKYSFGIERILEFGKELSQMGQQLEKENKMNEEDRQMLEDAFSLIAYSNPWSSPLGWQLCPTKREVVCKALNSAILHSLDSPKRPPLEICVSHAGELLKVMGQSAIGCSAFLNVSDVFPQN